MAETLVLANLTVDSSGVAGGINSANASLNQGQLILGRFGQAQTQVASTTSVVVGRLFNFRAALLAVARSFGIVGIIIGLAAALKTLITDLITSTTWFKKASESVNDWYRSLVLGEGGVDRLMRKMKQASDGGATSLLEVFERFKKLGAQRTATEAAVAGLPFFDTVNLAIAKDDLVTINAEMIKLADRLAAANISRDALFKATGFQVGISASGLPGAVGAGRAAGGSEAGELLGPQTILEQMGLPGPGVAEARVAEIVAALQFMQANAASIFGPSRAQIIESMADALRDVGLNAQQVGEIFASIGLPIDEVTAAVDSLDDSLSNLDETLPQMSEKAQAAFSVMQTAMQSVADTMSQAIINGSLNGKEALAALMGDIARACFAYAAMFVASGIAASTGIGAAVLQGTPAQFFKAAGLFAAAGVAAGLVARTVGGGGGGVSAGEGAGDIGAVGGTGGGGTSVSVIVHGSLIGSSEDDLARSLERLLRTARGDGG